MLTRDLIARFPKAELHNHLDGSLRPATLIELARDAGVPLPGTDPGTVGRLMLANDARCLEDYLARFDITVAVLQTPDAIERVAYEMVEDAAADNIRHLEVRYCPLLSCARGLTLENVLEAELRGLRRGEREFGVSTAVINCSLRHYDPSISIDIARVSVDFRDEGVVGFDLAGGERDRPARLHGPAFDLALAGQLGITVHAGEGAGADSIEDAIVRCHAHRIGHGTRLRENPRLRDFVRDHRIPLEINITSNVQTCVVAGPAQHPVADYLAEGLAVTLCTDSWLMSGTTLTDEYWLGHRELGFTRDQIERMILNGFEAAFLPWPEKERMLKAAKAELASIE